MCCTRFKANLRRTNHVPLIQRGYTGHDGQIVSVKLFGLRASRSIPFLLDWTLGQSELVLSFTARCVGGACDTAALKRTLLQSRQGSSR
jgi:hypothetical protein